MEMWEEVSTANVALSVVQQLHNYSNTADCDMITITIHKCVACSYRSVDTMKYCSPHYFRLHLVELSPVDNGQVDIQFCAVSLPRDYHLVVAHFDLQRYFDDFPEALAIVIVLARSCSHGWLLYCSAVSVPSRQVWFRGVQLTEMESVPSRRTNALGTFCIPCLTQRSMQTTSRACLVHTVEWSSGDS